MKVPVYLENNSGTRILAPSGKYIIIKYLETTGLASAPISSTKVSPKLTVVGVRPNTPLISTVRKQLLL